MKQYFIFILILCCTITKSFAETLYFTSPISGHTYNIPSGQSSMNIQASWYFQTDSSSYSIKLVTDVGTFNNISSGYMVQNVPYGSKHWTIVW